MARIKKSSKSMQCPGDCVRNCVENRVRNCARNDAQKCVISIDVGVKNLAICCIIVSQDGEIFVPFWKWYDVTKTEDVIAPKRTTVVKKKDKLDDKKDVPETGFCQNIIRKTGKPCGTKGALNSRGRAYCGRHDPTRKHSPKDTQAWCFMMLQRLPNITKEITETLQPWKIEGKLQVVIEQQAVDNKKILLQSHVIYSHFVGYYNNEVPIRFVPAYNKLLVYDGPEIACALKTPYAKRKYLAKRHTEYFLNELVHLKQWEPFFIQCKSKQDDISDAFLQGLYVLRGGRPKPEQQQVRKRRRKVRF